MSPTLKHLTINDDLKKKKVRYLNKMFHMQLLRNDSKNFNVFQHNAQMHAMKQCTPSQKSSYPFDKVKTPVLQSQKSSLILQINNVFNCSIKMVKYKDTITKQCTSFGGSQTAALNYLQITQICRAGEKLNI